MLHGESLRLDNRANVHYLFSHRELPQIAPWAFVIADFSQRGRREKSEWKCQRLAFHLHSLLPQNLMARRCSSKSFNVKLKHVQLRNERRSQQRSELVARQATTKSPRSILIIYNPTLNTQHLDHCKMLIRV